jgi:hypothetical protein
MGNIETLSLFENRDLVSCHWTEFTRFREGELESFHRSDCDVIASKPAMEGVQ